ncbi:PREDICTED: atherin-like [Chinchilla lanigera]|uniref:atherin-like n=1 Tax=Chinchilla lanigera TaxID=34839 RepID=UPI000696924C|nr:PREDICTED: atherin-like [Chinchilla lanigera]
MVASPAEGGRWGSPEQRGQRRRPELPPDLQHHRRPAPGSGDGAAPSQTSARRVRSGAMLGGPSPPLPASRAAAPQTPPPAPTRSPRRARSSEISTAPGTANPLPAPPPRPPGPPLPSPPGEEKNSLSSVNSAARRSLPLRPDSADRRPGIGGNQGLPRPPPARNCLLRPARIRGARPSAALDLWGRRQTMEINKEIQQQPPSAAERLGDGDPDPSTPGRRARAAVTLVFLQLFCDY